MKRVLSLLIVALLMIGPMAGFAAEPVRETDFRNVQWGMSIKDVRKAETLKLTKKLKDVLFYETKLAGLPCVLMYQFRAEALVEAAYLFEDSLQTQKEVLADYDRLKALLSEKYGKPTQDAVNWKDGLYKEVPSMWRMAVATGSLEYRTVWENKQTQVVLGIKGVDNKMIFSVWYFSRELAR